jgi:hypothetical protein
VAVKTRTREPCERLFATPTPRNVFAGVIGMNLRIRVQVERGFRVSIQVRIAVAIHDSRSYIDHVRVARSS